MGNFNNNKLFIIFSIIFLSLMVVSHMLNRSFVREILINEQLNILKSSSHRIEKWIENKKLSLKSVNSLISNLDHNKDEIIIKDILNKSTQIANFSSVYAGYKDKQTLSSGDFKAPPNYDPTLRPWYQNTIKTDEIYITKPYKDVGLKTSVISICQSIKQSKDIEGVLCGILSFNDIKNEILDLSLDDGGYLFLIDSNQNTLLHPNESLEHKKAKFDIENLDLAKTQNYETKNEIFTINPLQNSKLILIAKTPKDEIYKKINLQFIRNLAIYVVSALLFLCLGYFYNKKIKNQTELLEKTKREYEVLLFSQAKMIELGQMISSISHQWIQPLNALGIFLGNLVQFKRLGRLSDEIFYDNIDRSLKNIDYMTNTMIMFKNFYKIEEEAQEFNIKEAIDETIFILFSQHSKVQIKVLCKNSENLKCKNHLNEFKQIITCLIQNSKQALNERKELKYPKIVIPIKESGNFYEIRVIDNANGIDENLREEIFKPFKSTKNSSGLGLYISRLIAVKKCGGELNLSRIRKPTIFTLKIAKEISC